MNAARFTYAAVVALAALAAAVQAEAQTFGAHPALRGPSASVTLDPNHFIVGHPAGLTQRAGHANQAHPADTVSRQGAPGVDANHFLVQPPSSVHWAPAADEALAIASAR